MSLKFTFLEGTLWNSTVRVYLLRILLVSLIISLVTAPMIMLAQVPLIPSIFLSAEIILHHSLSIFRWKAFLQLIHWLLLTIEIVGWFVSGASNTYIIDRWATQKVIVGTSALYVQLVAIIILWIILTTQIIFNRAANLLSPYNFFLFDPLELDQSGSIRKAARVYFGRTLLKSTTLGDHKIVITVRVLCTLIILAGLCAFAALTIVIDPIRETGLTPSKSYHTTDIVYDFDMAPPVWSVVAYVDARLPVAHRIEDFKKAVNVTPLWDDTVNYAKPPCVHLPGSQSFGGAVEAVASEPYIRTITIFCPSRVPGRSKIQDLMTTPSNLVSPDLLITVNFTMLNLTQRSLAEERLRVVSILIGLTNKTSDVIANTLPTPLSAGSHLYGSVSRELRTRYDRPSSAAWGLFTSSHTFLIASILSLLPDPSPLVPRQENTGTLRLYSQDDFSEWLMEEDFRDKSVWAGLAAIGGFWTFVNGVFVYLFGCGLLWVLFGIKPLSIFGLFHRLQGEQIRQTWSQRFPSLETEGKDPEPGLVEFMREHVVDLEPILPRPNERKTTGRA